MTPIETCDECGFDSRRWNEQDTLNTLHPMGALWRYHLEGLADEVLQQRPDATTWSIAEYADHVREALWSMRFAVDLARQDPGAALPEVPDKPFDPVPRSINIETALDAVTTEGEALAALSRAIGPDRWSACSVVFDGEERDVGWWLRHGTHDAMHHLHDVGRIRHRLGAGAPSATGLVEQLNVSGGGVPKTPVPAADITWSGMEGDTQRARQHHGRPWQALCLWSTEVIDALQSEGHPIAPGAAGENVSISGVDWTTIRPGTRIQVGEAICEVSSYALPCTKNSQWFADSGHRRIEHELHPGWSRVYATVFEPGRVETGDQVIVEPIESP